LEAKRLMREVSLPSSVGREVERAFPPMDLQAKEGG